VALAGLLLLLVTSLLATRRKVQNVYTQLDEVNLLHRHVEAKLRLLRSDIHLSGIFVRDYLLDSSHLTGPSYRQRLAELRESTTGTLAEIERSVGPRQSSRIASLRRRLEDYWQTFDPLFAWTPGAKAALSSSFLRHEVLPRRDAVLKIASEIEEFNNANMREQRTQVAGRERELHAYLNGILAISLILGLGVSVAAVYRVVALEKLSEQQRDRAAQAETEMRRLSQQLVNAQEEERRSLSRELHDEVGQMLTGLRMEFGKAERAQALVDGGLRTHLAECKNLVDTLIDTVRHLSMGLRPSMLDDFGLSPALEWQSRDFARRYDVPVNLALEGEMDAIPEPHRTNVYRIVQEALTNCARHARANQISVSLKRDGGQLHLVVQDDGIGLKGAEQRSAGLGLLGIRERVRELEGLMSLHSSEGAGTTIRIDLPLPAQALYGHSANPRG
jgi:signal transduction histidine kinase